MNNYQTQTQRGGISSTVVIAVILLVLLAGVIGYQMMNKKEQEKIVVDNTISPTTGTTTEELSKDEVSKIGESNANLVTYKNGTYAVVGVYKSPAGPEEIGVTVILENSVIKDVTVDAKATNPVSIKRQGAFIEEYKNLVVGKNIDEVELSKVGGSSLTSAGFNDALDKVREQSMS